jgi:hypothetical protein
MAILVNGSPVICRTAILACAMALATMPMARGAWRGDTSQPSGLMPQTTCAFSDGATITFGRKASGSSPKLGADFWRAGEYEATILVVSERMIIPPLDGGVAIPPGRYTLFVKPDKVQPPWTLIISKKAKWGISYPGSRYDLGRSQMGSDLKPAVENFRIGCMQHGSAPIFVWMQSGTQVGYAKIVAEKMTAGKAEYLFH